MLYMRTWSDGPGEVSTTVQAPPDARADNDYRAQVAVKRSHVERIITVRCQRPQSFCPIAISWWTLAMFERCLQRSQSIDACSAARSAATHASRCWGRNTWFFRQGGYVFAVVSLPVSNIVVGNFNEILDIDF